MIFAPDAVYVKLRGPGDAIYVKLKDSWMKSPQSVTTARGEKSHFSSTWDYENIHAPVVK